MGSRGMGPMVAMRPLLTPWLVVTNLAPASDFWEELDGSLGSNDDPLPLGGPRRLASRFRGCRDCLGGAL